MENWEEAFYANNRDRDITPETLDYGAKYQGLENKLLSSYCPIQMEIYVSLESAREGFITELAKSFYRYGFIDALEINGTCAGD